MSNATTEDLFAEFDAQEQEKSSITQPEDVPLQVLPSAATFKFVTKTFVLRALFEKSRHVLPSKDTLPVLKNFQVEVTSQEGRGRLRVVATDLELSVVSTSEAVHVIAPGTAVFPGQRMLDIIKEADEGDVEINVVKGVAEIKAGNTEWDLRLQDGSEFPPLPEIADVNLVAVDRIKFLGSLAQVQYAAATETVRAAMMLIDISNGKMTACDGVRLQQVKFNDELDIQIPITAIGNLVKLLRASELPELGIGSSDNHLVFRIGSDVFIANKLTATFPDVEKMVLQPVLSNQDELHVDRTELQDAVKRVRITADPETSAIVLQLSDNLVTVMSKDKLGNTAKEGIAAIWSKGPRQLVVNHMFLTDMLAMADNKSCHFFLGTDTKTRKCSVLLKDAETGAIGTICQMRVDWVV